MKLDHIEFEEICAIIEPIAKQYERDSKEYLALERCCQILLYLFVWDARDDFLKYVNDEQKYILTGLDVIKLKIYGCEIPEEFRTAEVLALESEIDRLAATIEGFRSTILE